MIRGEAGEGVNWIDERLLGIVMAGGGGGGEDGGGPGDETDPDLPAGTGDDGGNEPAGRDPEPEGSAEPEPEEAKAAPPAPAPKQDWRDRRIAKLTAQLNEAKRAPAAAEAPPPEPSDPTEFNRRVASESARLASEAEFNRQCADVAESGKTAFGEAEFNQRVLALTATIDRTDEGEVAAYRGLIEAALATGEAAKIIHTLGADPNEAARIMALPPARMGVELAKLALAEGDSGSKAPPPARVPRGSGGGASPHTTIPASDKDRSDRLTTAEWMRRRDEEVRAGAGR